jgi:hypothetical protein
VGACTSALALTVLGFAGVPFAVALGLVLAGGAVAAVLAVRRAGPPPRPDAQAALVLWIAALVTCVALVPMFRAGFPTVIGGGSDAHLATGTAEFLQHHHPLAVAPEEPVDRVPLVWRSKQPIYYALGAVAALAGLETYETLATLAALLLGLTAAGIFLLARDVLGAGPAGAVAAMGLVALDRVVLHTVLNPYFNQTWGFFTLPFALVLGWWAVRARSGGAAALLALFLLVGAFAYPLAVPIPLLALLPFAWRERRRLLGAGATAVLGRRRRALAAGGAVATAGAVALLAVPLRGVTEKGWEAAKVVFDPNAPLGSWRGDLPDFLPEHWFVSLPSFPVLAVLALPLSAAVVWELRRQPRPLAAGLAAVLLFGLVAALWFRPRDGGWYFHFKALAFTAPFAVVLAAVALSRIRVAALGALALVAYVALALPAVRTELAQTTDQLNPALLELREVDRLLPPGVSVRLDLPPDGQQLWAGYLLAGQPLCSARPLNWTSYPHVPYSLGADVVVVDERAVGRPYGAVGRPLFDGERYALYRLARVLPGAAACSREMVQTIAEDDL